MREISIQSCRQAYLVLLTDDPRGLGLSDSESMEKIIKKAFQDDISGLLLKNSSLTKTQYETIIIDVLTDVMSDKKISFKEKTYFRSKKVSRGAFSRTLGQARRRVLESFFTVLLLQYVRVMEADPFMEFEQLAEKLREYLSSMEGTGKNMSSSQSKRLEEELVEGIGRLARPTSIKSL